MEDQLPPAAGDELSEELYELIKPELSPGERLLWAGRGSPRVRRSLTHSNPLTVPLFAAGSFVISGVFLAAFLGAFGRFAAKDLGALFMLGLMAGAIGLLLVIGMIGGWWSRRAERKRTAQARYALTDRRAIIWKPRSGTDAVEVYSYPRGKIKNVHRVEYPDGSGDVICDLPEEMYWGACNFEGVAEVRRVEELVRRFLVDTVAE